MATRKILAIIIALALVLGVIVCLSGCSSDTKEFELTESKYGGLVAISRQENLNDYSYDQTILYDPDTHVMYAMMSHGEGVAITVLYNADGTPKLYNPEK